MPKDKRPLKVFLCYAHVDVKAVRGLYTRLVIDGVDVWLDKEKLLPGQDWELEIRKAVRDADVVIVCFSKQFVQAGFKHKEVKWALDTAMEKPEGEIFIIPARIDECEPPDSLRKWHWVDLFEDDGYKKLSHSLQARAGEIGSSFPFTTKRVEEIKFTFNMDDLVSTVMRRVLVTVAPDASVDFAMQEMRDKRVHFLLVTPTKNYPDWRFFAETNLLYALGGGQDPKNIPVGEWSTDVKIVAGIEWTVKKALNCMIEHGVKHLPVADNDGNIIGIISSTDVSRAMNDYKE